MRVESIEDFFGHVHNYQCIELCSAILMMEIRNPQKHTQMKALVCCLQCNKYYSHHGQGNILPASQHPH